MDSFTVFELVYNLQLCRDAYEINWLCSNTLSTCQVAWLMFFLGAGPIMSAEQQSANDKHKTVSELKQ